MQIVSYHEHLDQNSNLNNKIDCIILPIAQEPNVTNQPAITKDFNNSNNNLITDLLNNKEITGEYGEIKWIYIPSHHLKILLIGTGDCAKLTELQYIDLLTLSLSQLKNQHHKNIIFGLTDVELLCKNSLHNLSLNILSTDSDNQADKLIWKIAQITQAIEESNNPPKNYKSKNQQPNKSDKPDNSDNQLINIQNFYLYNIDTNCYQDTIRNNQILARCIKTAKDLDNMTDNLCNPKYLEDKALALAKKYKNLKATVIPHSKLEKMGMGAFAAVSQGSNNPGCLIILEHTPKQAKNTNPYVLIGKGITFDTGGYTLKPAKSMIGMKYDMSGAASVFATMEAVCELELPLKVVTMMACAENMIGHKSTRPDDIVTTLSGKTIEINNTDAEGRLVLCDTLTYSKQYNPEVVIDVATLTGAAVMALGYHYTALYSNNQKLEQDLLKSSTQTFDPVWPMPLCKDYEKLMDSKFADMKNSSSMPVAGSITAANFLQQFIPDNTAWAHLDIAGSSTIIKGEEESTGRPVSLLVNYLLSRAE